MQADGKPSAFFMFHSGEGTIISKELRINEEVRCKEVRLIDDAGQQLGVMTPKEAAKIAAEKGLDLVDKYYYGKEEGQSLRTLAFCIEKTEYYS